MGGWLPATDRNDQMLLVRERAKQINLRVPALQQWSQEGLRDAILNQGMRPWFAVEAYVVSAAGYRRDLPAPGKRPPWHVRVDDMVFPLVLTFIEPCTPEEHTVAH